MITPRGNNANDDGEVQHPAGRPRAISVARQRASLQSGALRPTRSARLTDGMDSRSSSAVSPSVLRSASQSPQPRKRTMWPAAVVVLLAGACILMLAHPSSRLASLSAPYLWGLGFLAGAAAVSMAGFKPGCWAGLRGLGNNGSCRWRWWGVKVHRVPDVRMHAAVHVIALL